MDRLEFERISVLQIKKYSGTNRPPIDRLIAESEGEGFGMLTRLAVGWDSGQNRFDRKGEVLFLAWSKDDVIAVGGLNIDPYASDDSIGRVRHVYVSPTVRRQGIGRLLMSEIIGAAEHRFRRLRLRTDTSEGDRFYRTLGFELDLTSNESTHHLRLRVDSATTS